MATDEVRLTALKKGASGAGNARYVTIRTEDLRWLLEQVGASGGTPARSTSKPSDNKQDAK